MCWSCAGDGSPSHPPRSIDDCLDIPLSWTTSFPFPRSLLQTLRFFYDDHPFPSSLIYNPFFPHLLSLNLVWERVSQILLSSCLFYLSRRILGSLHLSMTWRFLFTLFVPFLLNPLAISGRWSPRSSHSTYPSIYSHHSAAPLHPDAQTDHCRRRCERGPRDRRRHACKGHRDTQTSSRGQHACEERQGRRRRLRAAESPKGRCFHLSRKFT